MNGRLISFAAALTTVVVFQPLAGCGETLPPENAAGSSATPAGAAGTVATAGVAGANVAGAITSGGGGSGGAATAGTGVGGQISAGNGGANAGTGTGGSSAGSGTAGSGTAGSGTAGGGSEVPATFAMVAALIKDRIAPHNCFGNSCHDGEHPYFHLLGEDQELLSDDALYTFMSGYNTRYCGKLINTASPAESALVKLLKGPCGATPLMPFDKCFVEDGEYIGDCVPPEYVDAIQRWIAAGAPR